MIIFLNDDRSYLYWVTHHRKGFVLDGRRKPRLGHLSLHRASCAEVKSGPSRRTRWTTGVKLKACSLNRSELETWAVEESGRPMAHCAACRPGIDQFPNGGDPGHLTKLAEEILDYVLDAALIHMEHEYPPYRLTVGDIAACFGKTPGQLSQALHQLLDEGFVSMCDRSAAAVLRPKQIVLPTAQALRTLEAFRQQGEALVMGELEKLKAD
jgi:hypothetical protein